MKKSTFSDLVNHEQNNSTEKESVIPKDIFGSMPDKSNPLNNII